jgi:hypothetical protein
MIYDFSQNAESPADYLQKHESVRTDVENRYSPVSIYNLNNDDIKNVKRHADEIINISGAEVIVYIRTDNSTTDNVWDEEPDPTYWNKTQLKAYFKPQPFELEMKLWGIDNKNKTEIVFSYLSIYDEFGDRLMRPGDVIQLPYGHIKGPKNYKVNNVTPSGNYRYTWLYLTCVAELLNSDIAIRPENDINPPIIEPEMRYKEHI